ncbi:endolytic transglycosylase MltG [Nocardia sp. alder85J]|uniref:endolytic transglycosylase MltG n=1 Tax=Nocardia sp. alder85J TaxID=2862949 RepID=UPI001CD23E95|nr:endolytic transglycosylase MltG [Nocardia sp. alder85J]MCX4091184.1 endolytic transglycosylase MltG [Nocardia sp. alder85J]
MSDRWSRAEERYRQETEARRYRREDQDWGADERPAPARRARHAAVSDDDDYLDDDHPSRDYPAYADPDYSGYGDPDHAARRADPGYAASGVAPGYATPGVASGYATPGGADPDHPAARPADPVYATPGRADPAHLAPGSADPAYPASGPLDPGFPASGPMEPVYAAPRHASPGYATPGAAAPGYADPDYADDDYHDDEYDDYPAPGRDVPVAPARVAAGPAARSREQPAVPPAAGRTTGGGARARGDRDRADRPYDAYEDDDTTVIPRYTDDAYDTDENLPVVTTPSQRRTRGADARRPKRARSGGSSGRGSRRSRAASRRAAERRRRRRNVILLGTLIAVLILAAGGYAGFKFVSGKFGNPADYSGPAGPLVVVQVQPGDTAEQIAKTMLTKGVVASTGAFYEAAVRNSEMKSVQPGFYAVPSHSKGSDAAAALVGKDARVGNVVVSSGRQLHDSNDVSTGARMEGIYRKIADASCIGTGTEKKCVTYEQLDAAGAGDPSVLGVPAWAMDAVRQAPDRSRQLEGLIAVGTWDFDPSGTPEQMLAQLVSASAHSYESTGVAGGSPANSLNPYQVLTAASLVEREALPNDMAKVARVIVNRLAANQPLQFDSTVNYTLDRTEVATTDADRARRTPWNTYAMSGLPATPISSPSLEALRAVENPAPGPWLYFVTVDKQGTTLFTDSYSEHLRNIDRARQSGILDSGR